MVLQQGKPITVWGTADDGEKVTVRIDGQARETTAEGGRFKVEIGPLSAGGPHTLSIEGKNKVVLEDVLVGEVWLASGQSNMQWGVAQSEDPKEVAGAANHPKLRLFTVPRERKNSPIESFAGSWDVCTPASVEQFTAVGYHFGSKLHEALGVPVGIISTNVGGTAAEEWTRKEILESNPELKGLLANPNSTKLYNGMIAPLVPFGIRGAIWYQGESNAGQAYLYRTLFPTMITNWREDFGQGEFPFLIVQLAPFQKKTSEPTESAWAELREAQLLTSLHLPKTGMVVITDLGDENDIHPKPKGPVGARLALAARSIAYGESVEYTGPVFKTARSESGEMILRFTHAESGLVCKGDTLTGFTICGEDKKFHNAKAVIEGDTVVVSCGEVARPVAVRYGWANFPQGNLWNKDGLPASPFRTDDFAGVTQPKP
jgi:sialate O-acetylesterase